MEYFLTGDGANKPPFNLFVVDHETGFVRITGIVDRETHPNFSVSLSSCFFTVWAGSQTFRENWLSSVSTLFF